MTGKGFKKRRGHLTIIELLGDIVVSGRVLQVEEALGVLLGVPALCGVVLNKLNLKIRF